MTPSQSESDAMAAFMAARRAGVSLEEQGRLWAEAEKQAEQQMQEKLKEQELKK